MTHEQVPARRKARQEVHDPRSEIHHRLTTGSREPVEISKGGLGGFVELIPSRTFQLPEVQFPQSGVATRLTPADDRGRLDSPEQVRAPDRIELDAIEPAGEQDRLCSAPIVQLDVGPTLKT